MRWGCRRFGFVGGVASEMGFSGELWCGQDVFVFFFSPFMDFTFMDFTFVGIGKITKPKNDQ